MKVRCVASAFVSAVLFAGLAANSGSALATSVAATSLAQSGYAALSQGDAAKSIPLFTQSIESRELGPEALANAFFNRGLAHQKLGQSSNAVDDYTAALTLDAMPSDLRSKVLYNRGLSQQQLGHASLAIEDYTSALLIDSSFSYAYLARANTLRDSGQYLFSISDYERALKYHHPDAAHVYYGEGLTYEALKRPSDAKRLYQQAVSLQPSFAAANDRLKALGGVAENDDMAADPIMTASTAPANPAATTEVVAQSLPKAVEPPSGLLSSEATPPAPAVAVPAEAAVANTAAPAPEPEKKVLVASVPTVPSKPVKAADPVMTASVTPARPAPVVHDAPTPAVSGWTVQISSAASEDAAWTSFKTMQKGHAVLASEKPVVVKADLGAKGTVYRVRLQGFESQAKAQAACGKLKASGVSCFIAKA